MPMALSGLEFMRLIDEAKGVNRVSSAVVHVYDHFAAVLAITVQAVATSPST